MGNYCLMTNTYSIALLSFLLCVGEMMRVIEQLQHTATVPPLHSLCENFGSAGSWGRRFTRVTESCCPAAPSASVPLAGERREAYGFSLERRFPPWALCVSLCPQGKRKEAKKSKRNSRFQWASFKCTLRARRCEVCADRWQPPQSQGAPARRCVATRGSWREPNTAALSRGTQRNLMLVSKDRRSSSALPRRFALRASEVACWDVGTCFGGKLHHIPGQPVPVPDHSFIKEWSPGKWWSPHPWRGLKQLVDMTLWDMV